MKLRMIFYEMTNPNNTRREKIIEVPDRDDDMNEYARQLWIEWASQFVGGGWEFIEDE